MLHAASIFFILALVAALFGFTGLVTGAAVMAKVLFVLFLILFVVALVASKFRGPRT